MRYKVNVTLVSEIDLYVDANNRTEAASKAYKLAQSRDRIIERGDFSAVVSASDAIEID